jgi:hypothetical protein
MLVTAVGVHSFQGKTLLSLQTPDEVTPLQEKLEVIATNILPLPLFSLFYFLLFTCTDRLRRPRSCCTDAPNRNS